MAEQITCEPLEALNEALCHEEEARVFYLKAAQHTQDPDGAKMFAHLATTAAAHIEILEQQVNSLTDEDRWVLPECVFNCEVNLDDPFLPRGREALEKTIRKNADDQDAILFALGTVHRSFDMYRKQARAADDPIARRIYEYLTEQATTQRDLLMLAFERSAPYAALYG